MEIGPSVKKLFPETVLRHSIDYPAFLLEQFRKRTIHFFHFSYELVEMDS